MHSNDLEVWLFLVSFGSQFLTRFFFFGVVLGLVFFVYINALSIDFYVEKSIICINVV